ncbi:MAG: ATP-binding protein [Candidatus Micrarchaeia archaeon]
MDYPETSREIKVPTNPIDKVIGQDEAIKYVKIAASQKRHILLVGAPGTGKSMIAQAMASLLPKPNYEISVLDNPEHPERPILEIRSRLDIEHEKKIPKPKIVKPVDVPVIVAERLGLRCKRCGFLSKPEISTCPNCGADKYKTHTSPFDDIVFGGSTREDRVFSSEYINGVEQKVMYEYKKGNIYLYDEEALAAREHATVQRNVIVPLERSLFVQATGASETELLGDVRHDPYGGHSEIGTKPFKRVVPGAVHEAHEGVLFIDELSNLGQLQRHLLTAMQEKKFPITGRNPTSSGASVRVDNVPCDFILVGAINFADVGTLLPPLRSRILGNGFEVLMNTVMEDNEKNVKKLMQFIAQEIIADGRIPHANAKAIEAIINEARRKAKLYDNKEGLTLRLRDLSGIVKLAGDFAVIDGAELIEEKHVALAIEKAKPIEQQMQKKYGSVWRTSASDYGVSKAPDEHIF